MRTTPKRRAGQLWPLDVLSSAGLHGSIMMAGGDQFLAENKCRMRIAWLTDLHLNFVTQERVMELIEDIKSARVEAMLIGGDTGESDSFASYLQILAQEVELPIYFVLGNHDYYQGSIRGTREKAHKLQCRSPWLHWLPESGVTLIGEQTALVGHGGWGDARAGDFLSSDVALNDYVLIEELHEPGGFAQETMLSESLMRKLNHLGNEAASHFEQVVPLAAKQRREIVALTHVPPYREACWHEGHLSDQNWAPHFVCQAVGEVMTAVMQHRPDCRMTVLCGHTHSAGEARILDNLKVLTGSARYGHPVIQQVLEVA